MSYVLLIIDPQVDFHEGGNLGVTGATKDSENIIKLIQSKPPAAVYVSLDTHTHTHIGHDGFWEPTPPTSTMFSVKDGKVMGSDGVEYKPKPTGDAAIDEQLKGWVLKYIEEVPGFGKGTPLIWPTHCIEGEPGHAVYAPLKAALDELSASGVPVEYHIKGQNEATEMYSIFKAEMPAPINLYRGSLPVGVGSKIGVPNSDEADHANLETNFNMELFNSVMGRGLPVAVCGEALSHCVNWSTRDLNEKKKETGAQNPIYLLEDATSMVVLPFAPDLFVPQTEAFKQYCDDNGVVRSMTDAFISSQAGGRRRRRRATARRGRTNMYKRRKGGRSKRYKYRR